MASIQKRGKKYAVVYTYTDSADVKRQKWETYGTKKEAAARKAQVENEMNNGTFIPPSSVTVRDFLADFVELYGSKRWGAFSLFWKHRDHQQLHQSSHWRYECPGCDKAYRRQLHRPTAKDETRQHNIPKRTLGILAAQHD